MQIANPASFQAQKILIHGRRNRHDTTARRIFSTCMTQSRLSLRKLPSCALNGRTSGPSFTRTALALCSAQRHWYLEKSPIRFVPHRESSWAERCLQKRFERPAVWDLLGCSEKETVKNKCALVHPELHDRCFPQLSTVPTAIRVVPIVPADRHCRVLVLANLPHWGSRSERFRFGADSEFYPPRAQCKCVAPRLAPTQETAVLYFTT